MRPSILRRDQAVSDLAAIAEHIAKDRPKSAERFLKEAEKTIESLADMPLLGGRCEFSSPHLQDVRIWSVRKFRNYLIFYRPIDNGIEVLRVIHGARDLEILVG